ncbi:MAG TPA: DUF2723 domain-containing protein [Candidatus Polarisedimenticolaceae bacterium]|nr:DUF2723 domain-containing protein [Candidatus Polarisedimenticolaceae bacterium]
MSFSEHRAELACAVGALALYAATACRTVFPGDGGELIAASQALGVAHPPGYPLWTLLAKAALLVPAGEPAFRTTMLSALLGALACALAAHLARRWSGGSAMAGIVAGALLAIARTFWFSATVTEVYTAHVLVALALLWAAERRSLPLLGLLAGVGLAHHPTIVLVLPSAVLLARQPRGRARSKEWVVAAGLAVGVAAIAYATLLLRARWVPEFTWNHFSGTRAWWEHVTAAAYRPFDLGVAGLFRPEGWKHVLEALALDLGPAGLLLAVGGVMAAKRLRVPLLLLIALHVGFALRYGTEDVDVYLLPAVAALCVLSGVGAAQALAWRPRVATAAVLLAVLAQGAWRFREMDLRTVTVGADYAADVLRSVPQGGTLVADGDNVFLLQYATQVLGERSDLTVYDRGGHVLRTLPPGREGMLTEAAFLSWPGYEAPAGLRFRPHGLVYLLEPDGPIPSDEAFWEEAHEARVRMQAVGSGDLLARTLAASYPILRGERALFEGDVAGAERRFQEARSLAGDSETVRNTLGTIYGRRGDLHRAAIEFESALRLKPASPRAAANLRLVRQLQRR